MPHSTSVMLITAEEEVIWWSRSRVDSLVAQGYAYYVSKSKARMLGAERRELRPRKSSEPGKGGPVVVQRVRI